MSEAPRILIFDSGLGGLTVFREIVAARPDAEYVYVADDAFFPYSDHSEAVLTERVLSVMEQLISEHEPDLVVIACNTASTLVLSHLRARFQVPFVGTVPAIKPACAVSTSRLVSVLGTAATVTREYTQGLIRDFAQDCDITLVGSDRLASIAEAVLRKEAVDEQEISAQIGDCFMEQNGRRTDVVVLGCTHYPLIIDYLQRLAPWPVRWLDPAEAIARRVVDLLGPRDAGAASGSSRIVFTSGKSPEGGLAESLALFQIGPAYSH